MITLNADIAKVIADPEWGHILEALPPETTMEDVLNRFDDDLITPEQMMLEVRAFWNAQANMVRIYKTQAEDWRKIVEGLRRELDGLRPE